MKIVPNDYTFTTTDWLVMTISATIIFLTLLGVHYEKYMGATGATNIFMAITGVVIIILTILLVVILWFKVR